jgi:beta-mannosidase
MTHELHPDFDEWTLAALPAGAVAHPRDLEAAGPRWIAATMPSTVAAALERAGQWKLGESLKTDESDWWFRTLFLAPKFGHCAIAFDGLATLAEVWLNGEQILTSDNMFRSHRVDFAGMLQPKNDVVIVFRSLNQALSEKKPRPRWKTNLVANQQLRWQRTTLLGRIPGWSPPVAPVGPWRGVRLETDPIQLITPRVQSRIDANHGVVDFDASIIGVNPIDRATFHVGENAVSANVEPGGRCRARLHIAHAKLWWPTTHGDQPLTPASLIVDAGGETKTFDLGRVGFRTIDRVPGKRFALEVNGQGVYCRGACWTVSDIVTLTGTRESLRRDLQLAKAAGVNMLRVGGTMVYESDDFYDLCDELGIMVWQDFMFANMDYPVDDPAFAANIRAEAIEQLVRLSRHPCIAVYCGNSEVEQQAAMLGMPAELWRNSWFSETLPALCSEHHPGVPYVPSTPSGGALPFHLREGVAHYYGVGAYQRTPADVRKDDVAFTPECLGFANIPEPATLNEAFRGDVPVVHDPRWKERSPRDTGPGWDFDDVRDFYLKHLFAVDPVRMRSFDPERYLQLSRVVPGEMMTQVFSEWRGGARNAGGLVWFFKDLWPGAGWGIIDSHGIPKATYYALRRIWQPLQVAITREDLEGLAIHVINERADPFRGTVELLLLKDDHIIVAKSQTACEVAGRSQIALSADAVFGTFYDLAYAYRFGPPKHDVTIATLLDENGIVVSEAFDFPMPREPILRPAAVRAEIRPLGDAFEATVESDHFLRHVALDLKGLLPADNYFHVVPGRSKVVRLAPTAKPAMRIGGTLDALNLLGPVKFAITTIAETGGTR